MKTNKLASRLAQVKGIDSQQKTVTAYVSTYQWDRMDERFAKGAWRLDTYKQNPVTLWAHDYSRPPIGKAMTLSEDDNGLLAVTQFAPDEFSQQIFQLFEGGFLSAFSVGFNPKTFVMEPIDANRKGVVFTEAELLEYSAVPIPANPGALVTHDLAQIAIKCLGDKAVREVKADGQSKWLVAPAGQEEPAAEEPKPALQPEKDLEASLKYISELARTVKGQKLDANHLGLLTSAVGVFQDIITENQGGVPAEAVQKLAEVVNKYATVIENLFPDASLTVRRAMNQIDKALREQRRVA
jgi:HK97 family phage prohead protease